MKNYLARLLKHIDDGGQLLDFPGRPVSRDLVERLVEYFSSPRSDLDSGQELVHGTRLVMIRTGLVLERVIDSVWHMMLGRKCSSLLEIGPKARLKTPGGYAKFSQSIERRDPSVVGALLRELDEEGFTGLYDVRSRTVAPVCSLRAKPEGMLHFYSGRMDGYPDLPSGGLAVMKECDDGEKIFAGYFTLDEIVKTLENPKSAMIHGETVVAAVNRYFWRRSERIDMCDRHEKATPEGNLVIDPGVRDSIFARIGLPPEKKYPKLSRCRVYCSIPVHARHVFAVRMFLATDIFLHQDEFSPDEGALKEFMDRYPNTQGEHSDLAKDFVVEYLERNYSNILEEEIWKKYVRPS
jgi:hypothetical protein